MEKKNTILLTVIAVATLLVAVVGASFAFFAVQETNNADVEVETTTAEAADAFVATSEGDLKLAVTNATMQEAESTLGKYVSDTATVNVSLTAGSGNASCDYKLTYKAAEGTDTYTTTSGITGFEYSLQGVVTEDENIKIAETNMDQVSSFGIFTITDSVDNAETQVASEHNWTIEVRFYNLAVNQGVVQGEDGSVTSQGQIGKTFAGNIVVDNVSCTNTAN